MANIEDTNTILAGLSDKEREAALLVLREISEKGQSDTLNHLIYDDYEEIPVDIDTFIDDPKYLGNAWKDAQGNSKLYPIWRDTLHKIFPTNIDTAINNLIESGCRGAGKQQSIYSYILTEHGYVQLKDINVGDKVYGRDGKLHTITHIFPQGIKPCYDVVFSDDSKTTSGPQHLWTLKRDDSRAKWRTVELQDIFDTYLRKDRPGSPVYKVPVCEPIQFEKKELPIHPYVLGVLLGDGCLSNNSMSFVSVDDEIINNVAQNLKENYKITVTNRTPDANNKSKIINIVREHKKRQPNDYLVDLQNLGLRGTKSATKFIPDLYKYSSVEDRIALLQGLMDTDGSAEANPIKKDKSISYKLCYYTVSHQLAKDIIWLVQSLGGTATCHLERHANVKTVYLNSTIIPKHDTYALSINLPSYIDPFRLSRKLNRYIATSHREPSKYIKNIVYRGEEECVCILIDDGTPNEEHLYITDDFIVTHNSEIAVLISAYLMYRLICLKKPLEHYFMKPTEKFCFAFMNIKLEDAEDIANHKFQNTVKLSPWFLEHGTLTGRNKDTWVPPDYIQIIVGSQSSDIIGKPIFLAFFDEISFIRNQDIDKQKEKAKDMMNTAIGGMKTRFIHGGKNPTLLILASSKRSDKSFLEEHMKKSLEADGDNVLIIDKAVWDFKPPGTYSKQTFNVAVGNKYLVSTIVSDENVETYRKRGYKIINPPIDFLSDFKKDMDRALCDFAGISSSELSKYISGTAVQETVNKTFKNPFVQEILEIGNDMEDKAQYYEFFDMTLVPKDMMDKPLYIHLDMSISGDMTGIAGVWIKGKKPSTDALKQANDLYYRVAFAVNIKAPKGRQIAFEKNRNFIYWLKEQGFNIKGVSTDSFQAYDTGQALTAKGYNYKMISVDKVDTNKVCVPYQYYKNTIYEGRVEVFPCKTLEDELTDLERNINTGKVDHPEGGKKDIADAVCGAIFNASAYAEQFAYDYGENLSLALDVNNKNDAATSMQQLTVNMEEELKLMRRQGMLNQAPPPQPPSQPKQPDKVGPTESKIVEWNKPDPGNNWFII